MKTAIDLTALDDNFTGIERYALNMALALIRAERRTRKETEQESSESCLETGTGYRGETGTVPAEERTEFTLIFKNRIFPDFLPFAEDPGVHFHILKGCRKLWFNQWRLPMYLNRLDADVFLFFAFPMPVLLRKKHVLGTIHDMGCWDCPETMKRSMAWYFRLSYRWMARRAERIITVSEFSRNRILDILKIGKEKTILTYNGLAESFWHAGNIAPEERRRIREKYGLPDEYCLCLSTLEPRKNMLLLLDTCLRLYQQGRLKTKLVLAGRKGWKIDKLLAQAGAVQDSVRITGFIEDDDLPAVYRMARCFIFPSLYEGFGIPPLEAMSQGVPVIASDSSSLPEILGDAAFYFRNNDERDLERALLEFEQESPERIREKIQAGYERSRRFRYEAEAEKLRGFFVKKISL